MAKKPGKKPKEKKMTSKEQSERFKQTARDIEADESGESFERAFAKLIPAQTKKSGK